jgi:hypothetical protein
MNLQAGTRHDLLLLECSEVTSSDHETPPDMAAVHVKTFRQLLMTTLRLARSDGLIETEAAAAPPPSRPSRLPRWQIEALLVALLYGAYDATRGLQHSTVVTANHNGWLLLHVERHLHVAPEHRLNQLLWHLPGLAVPSAYFYATLHFIVTPGVLVWLYRRHPDSYRTARRVLVVATAASLVGFWLFPTAPPRLLPGSGIRDTLADVHQWGWWAGPSSAPRGLSGLANEYAAMPSLHVAWALWAGWLVTRHARYHLIRIAGASYPVLTACVVMATGNHYLLDVLAGAAVLALASVAVKAAARPKRMLRAAGGRISMRKIAAMTYAGNAVSMTLPAGAAISSRCTLRRLRTGGQRTLGLVGMVRCPAAATRATAGSLVSRPPRRDDGT